MTDLTAELLEAIGRALHGERWQTGLAADLETDLRYLQRIARGERPVPGWLGDELLPLLRARHAEIDGLITRLERERLGAEAPTN